MRRGRPDGATSSEGKETMFPGSIGMSRWQGLFAALAATGIVAGALYIRDARSCATNVETMEARERVFELHIKDGRVAVDVRTVRAWRDDTVHPRWTADKPVVLHLRGYAIERKVTPGGNAEVTFKADVTCRFPVAALSGPRPHGPGRRGPLVMVEIYPR